MRRRRENERTVRGVRCVKWRGALAFVRFGSVRTRSAYFARWRTRGSTWAARRSLWCGWADCSSGCTSLTQSLCCARLSLSWRRLTWCYVTYCRSYSKKNHWTSHAHPFPASEVKWSEVSRKTYSYLSWGPAAESRPFEMRWDGDRMLYCLPDVREIIIYCNRTQDYMYNRKYFSWDGLSI